MKVMSKHEEIQLFYQAETCKLIPSIIIFFPFSMWQMLQNDIVTYVGEDVSKHTSL